jgi:hypothetical protein
MELITYPCLIIAKTMKATHREQIDFIKKRISKGNKGKELLRRFRRRWDLSTKTFKRRLAIARHEILHGSSPTAPAWVLLSMPGGTDINGQQAENSRGQKSGDKEGQYSNPVAGQNTTEAPLKNSTATEGQKPEAEGGQKSTAQQGQNRQLQEATERLLSIPELSTADCLFMLTRFAMGQFSRKREVLYKGQVVELNDTPNFSQRKAAVLAIMKYHATNKNTTSAAEFPTIPIKIRELLDIENMTSDRIQQLMQQFRDAKAKRDMEQMHRW